MMSWKLKIHFAWYSDNGAQYMEEELKRFITKWELEHNISSPGWPQNNGKAESAVKTAKSLIKRAIRTRYNPYLVLLDHGNRDLLATQPRHWWGEEPGHCFPLSDSLVQLVEENRQNLVAPHRTARQKSNVLLPQNGGKRPLSKLLLGQEHMKLSLRVSSWEETINSCRAAISGNQYVEAVETSGHWLSLGFNHQVARGQRARYSKKYRWPQRRP